MRSPFFIFPLTSLLTAIPCSVMADDVDKFFGGLWMATAMEREGVEDGPEVFKRIKFRFSKNRKVTIQGNGSGDGEGQFIFEVDLKSKPMEIDFVDEGQSIRGIFRWIMPGREIQLCIRHGVAQEKGRPKEFKTSKGSDLILLKLKRQK